MASTEEITLEANPSRREAPDWIGLRAAGVTRISLGAQSLRDADLRALARGHSAAEVRAAFRDARAAGFDNVSLDLIYGIPSQTLGSWRSVLRRAIAMQPEHLSLMRFSSPWHPTSGPRPRVRVRCAGAGVWPPNRTTAWPPRSTPPPRSSWTRPATATTSSRPGRCPAASHGTTRPTGIAGRTPAWEPARTRSTAWTRSWNVRDLDCYLAAAEAGERPVAGSERLDGPTAAFEAMALGLRRVDGLSRAGFAREFGADPLARFGPALRTPRMPGCWRSMPAG